MALPPGRDLEQAEVERSWTEDRSRLLRCADTKAALQGYYQHRDAGLSQ